LSLQGSFGHFSIFQYNALLMIPSMWALRSEEL